MAFTFYFPQYTMVALNKVNVCNMDTLREFLSWGVVSVSIPDIYGYVVRKT